MGGILKEMIVNVMVKGVYGILKFESGGSPVATSAGKTARVARPYSYPAALW